MAKTIVKEYHNGKIVDVRLFNTKQDAAKYMNSRKKQFTIPERVSKALKFTTSQAQNIPVANPRKKKVVAKKKVTKKTTKRK